jgi:hypothetical protein
MTMMTTPDVALSSLEELPSVGISSTTAGRKKLLHLAAGTVKIVPSTHSLFTYYFVIYDE